MNGTQTQMSKYLLSTFSPNMVSGNVSIDLRRIGEEESRQYIHSNYGDFVACFRNPSYASLIFDILGFDVVVYTGKINLKPGDVAIVISGPHLINPDRVWDDNDLERIASKLNWDLVTIKELPNG